MKNNMRQIEPTFLGVSCTGQNPEQVKRLKEQIDASSLLMAFYKLDRAGQLAMAALITEMTTDRDK